MKLVIQNTSAVWGGNEKWLATVAAGLQRKGHDVKVSCSNGPVSQGLSARGVKTTHVRPRGAVDVASGLTFAAWLRGQQADALLITSWHTLSWTVWAASTAGAGRIVLRQGIVREFPRSGPRVRALRRVDAIIANSDDIRDTWNRTAPPDLQDRIKVVFNGVESERKHRDHARRRLCREVGATDDDLLIGGAGHLVPRKGFDYLLRGFAKSGIANTRVVIAGEGDHQPTLEGLAEQLGIAKRVHWLGHRHNAAEIIAGLDLFILSSHNEGMANVMLEAMAAGTPVVAFDVSGVQQAIGPANGRRVAGWIVPAGDEAALSEAMKCVVHLLRSPSGKVRERTEEAHWRIENWFGIDRMIDECEAILFR